MLYVKSLRGRNLENSTSSKSRRELRCLAATAIDADRFPILAAHWPGLLIVDGRLACHDNAPIRSRFKAEAAHE